MVKTSGLKDFIRIAFFMVLIFAFGGSGLGVLFNSKGELVEIIGGFILIGISISIFYYKFIKNE